MGDRTRLLLVLVVLVGAMFVNGSCSSTPMVTADAGAAGGTAGGTAGASGGGDGGGGETCSHDFVPECGCSGGGSSVPAGAVVFASRTPDSSAVRVNVNSAALWMPQGVPGVLAANGARDWPRIVVSVKSDETPAQVWSGNMLPRFPEGAVCDPPQTLPAVTRAWGMATIVAGELWYVRKPGTVARAVGLSGPLSIFEWPGHVLGEFAYDPASDRLFAAATDGGSVGVWRNARARPGDAGTPDFELSVDALRSLVIAEGRLYAASGTAQQIQVWGSLATLDQQRAHDFVLTLDGGTPVHQAVNDGRLVVTLRNGPAGRVLFYDQLSSDAGDRAPAAAVEHPELAAAVKSALTAPRNLLLSPPSQLLVLTESGLMSFTTPLTAPALVGPADAGLGVSIDLVHFD